MQRRDLINGGFLSGLTTLASPSSAAAQRSDEPEIARAIDKLSDLLQRAGSVSPELTRIREQQRAFLKLNQKFPDFIEIGINVWDSVCDWHIRHQQPMTIGRTTEGRYTLTVLLTALVLRPDQTDNYVGLGFDAR
jgi:hypothetical protein